MIEHASGDPSQYKTYYFACAHYDEWKVSFTSFTAFYGILVMDSCFCNLFPDNT